MNILEFVAVILGKIFQKKSEYGQLKLNGLHRDHPPAWEILEVKNRFPIKKDFIQIFNVILNNHIRVSAYLLRNR